MPLLRKRAVFSFCAQGDKPLPNLGTLGRKSEIRTTIFILTPNSNSSYSPISAEWRLFRKQRTIWLSTNLDVWGIEDDLLSFMRFRFI